MIFFIGLFIFQVVADGDISPAHIKYLQDNGYLSPPNHYVGALRSRDDVIKSIRKFQEFARLPATGKIDHKTILKFQQARCGMKDIVPKERRNRRYVLQGSKWYKKTLTYNIINYSNDLTRKQIYQTIRKALRQWQAASQIKFIGKTQGKVDIVIKFTRNNHNDPYPFDGPGGTLAHAFYPGTHDLAGDTHFDDDETFTLHNKKGKNFYWVALHEFGHALGLEHGNSKDSVMYPWYEGYNGKDTNLSSDDKRGLQELYGQPTLTHTDMLPLPSATCLNKVKTIFRGYRLDTIVVNDDKVYLYDVFMKLKKGPLYLSRYYPGLKGVDAGYTMRNSRARIFYKNDYWEYFGRRRVNGPNDVSQLGFVSGMNNLNAALRWGNGKIYLFKGDIYWRYDESKRRVDPGYPKRIKDGWHGVPNNFDSAHRWRDEIYIFKGSSFYRFNKRRYEVYKPYPLPIRNNFLMCRKNYASRFYMANKSPSCRLTYGTMVSSILLILYVTLNQN